MGGKRKTRRRRGPAHRATAGARRETALELDELVPGAGEANGAGDPPAVPVAAGIFQVNASVNDVRVDIAELNGEAERVALDALAADAAGAAAAVPAAPELDPDAPVVENAEEGYKILALAIVAQGADLLAPQWQISIPEKTELSDAMVQALLLWFPDGLIPAKYLALLVIMGIVGKIAMKRRDPTTGILLARHAAIPAKTAAPRPGSSTGPAAQPERAPA